MIGLRNLVVGGITLSLLCLPVGLQAEDATEAEAPPPIYWIGVQVVPVPELFLSHFGVNDESGGLIAVERVVPDGPAATAGVKRGDVIRKFGEKEIYALPDLIEAVAKVKEAAAELEVIRDGAKKMLTVTPVPRPEDIRSIPGVLNLREVPQVQPFGRRLPMNAFPGRDPQQMMRQMEEFFRQMQGGDDGDETFIVPNTPNIPQRGIDTGKQLSVVTQTQDGKTTIKVTQTLKDGEKTEKKTWEVENVDGLPEEIRGDVKMLLGR